MKLRSGNRVARNKSGHRLAIIGCRNKISRIAHFEMIGMHEISMQRFGNIREQSMVADEFQRVPSHMRNFQRGIFGLDFDDIAADLAGKEIEAEIEARKQASAIIIAEQGRWSTAIIRPLLAAPVIIYFWKVLVIDKVLDLGSTDPLTGMVYFTLTNNAATQRPLAAVDAANPRLYNDERSNGAAQRGNPNGYPADQARLSGLDTCPSHDHSAATPICPACNRSVVFRTRLRSRRTVELSYPLKICFKRPHRRSDVPKNQSAIG